jgi:serine/threonine-protein kinase
MKVCTTCGAEYGDEKLFCERDGTPLRKSGAASDLVGMVIAERYHITKKLGEGGMGQVYLAEHVKMGRRCAIKIMMPGTMSDPEAISRFNREAANASRISHPNVCAIYDFGETPDGLIYLAMEFIEGKSLTDLLAEAGTLPLARAATMIQQSAEALQMAHELGIVHRDLKPDNIMVSTSRGKDTVKVVDFGIAKAIGGDDGKAQKVTKTGFVVGTPEYMSPEQLAGDAVDGRSDLYSLGLVFYRMLTGASPFPADSQQETMIKRLTDDPMPLAVARPDVTFPPEVQRVLDRALARQPNDRYRSASEFAREVRGLSAYATGQVDVDAGTQKVRPEELKAAMPATRVDPAGGALRPKALPGSEKAATRPAKKGIPAVPVAIAVVVLAAAGGVFALRDRLFGGAAAAVPDSAENRSPKGEHAGDSARAQPFNRPDTTTRTPDPGAGGPTGNPPGGGRSPTGATPAGPRRDSVPKPPPGGYPTIPDIAGLERRLNVYYDDIDFVDDAAKRLAAKQLGEQIFGNSTVPPMLRARAAFVVGQVYIKEQDMSAARQWMDDAIKLDPSQGTWKRIRDQL